MTLSHTHRHILYLSSSANVCFTEVGHYFLCLERRIAAICFPATRKIENKSF